MNCKVFGKKGFKNGIFGAFSLERTITKNAIPEILEWRFIIPFKNGVFEKFSMQTIFPPRQAEGRQLVTCFSYGARSVSGVPVSVFGPLVLIL